jgi:iron complex outermembrane receptor protein
MKRLTFLNLVGAGLILCSLVTVGAQDEHTEQAVITSLKSLDFSQLPEVEVSLDAAFDVFDGLIQAKKTTVATGIRQYTNRAPSVTTVITAQDIEAMGARDLDEVLETVPGLHVARIKDYQPIYTIRGIFTQVNPEILMLINGIPLKSLYLGSRGQSWGGLPINMISRIEVIRGPGSAVYGADAFAGVINIITKTKEDINGTEVGTRIGSFNTYESWVLFGNNWKGVDIVASLEGLTTDGQKGIVREDAQTLYDKLYHTHASLAPGPVNVGVDAIDARIDVKKGYGQARLGYQGRRNLETGTNMTQALDPQGHRTGDRINADLTYHNPDFAPQWDVTAQLSYLDMKPLYSENLYPPGAFGGRYPDGYIIHFGAPERQVRLDTFAVYSGFQQHLFRLGTGYHFGDQYQVTDIQNYGTNPATGLPLPPGAPLVDLSNTPYAFTKQGKRNSGYLSLQDAWTLANDWELTAGIRYDDYSDFGGTTNPRSALVWQPRHDFTSKLMFGRAFRAPAFVELYSINNPVRTGNPNLKPEVINTWELAFDYRATQHLHLAANLFRYDINDKIDYVPNPDGKAIIAQNVSRWNGEGFELEARWKMSAWSSLLANYSYVKATDKGNGHDIGNYPQQSAYIRTDWLLKPNWYLDAQAKWIADRQRAFGDPRPPIADYTTVDLTLRYKDIRDGRANIAFSIRNLLNNMKAREPSIGPDTKGMIALPDDLPYIAKRNVFIELRYRF